ncbi:MAG: ATP-dependent RecD-like DNA helicase [Paramuribaculum sp.]|nr:ATP-dependent RecD-like DNA helicase [Paramuribaculum sp.]
MEECDKWIRNSDQAICLNLDAGDVVDRGFLSINILGQIRNLVDNVCVKIFLSNGGRKESAYYNNIKNAKPWVGARYGFIKRLNKLLQISTSHYTCDPEGSERLMLKYYAYLLKLKKLMADEYRTDILHNLWKFPLDTDHTFAEYHQAIATEIDSIDMRFAITDEKRFYIYRTRPFFVKGEIYYEVTFSIANEWASKFDRMIAFSKIEVLPNYASFMRITSTNISVFGVKMPILIIVDWKPAIRICEFRNLARIVGLTYPNSQTREYHNLMGLISQYMYTLPDIMDLDDPMFDSVMSQISSGGKTYHLTELLRKCRSLIKNGGDGALVLRYLMFRMSNKIIKSQYSGERCRLLSDLYVKRSCKPFDSKPFYFSLPDHNPMLSDLLDCIPTEGHESELLARRLVSNAEHRGMMYTPIADLDGFSDLDRLIENHNGTLIPRHSYARIEKAGRYLYIRKYEDCVKRILQHLTTLTESGISNYSAMAENWITSPFGNIDCEEKKGALRNLFSDSHVAFVYGAAGTGKSTFINHISSIFDDKSKIFLANTNPAVENLRRKVRCSDGRFMTISKYLYSSNVGCDILFVDECSTVSNEDMLAILTRQSFRLIVLVGDMYQIEAIQFGNWFGICNSHFKGTYVVELTKPYRTSNPDLIDTWERVRKLSDDILEFLARNGYSSRLDKSIFDKTEDDEIILCLNYEGLYGINNINRFLQSNNPNPEIKWGVYTYKKGDPILFNDVRRFSPYLYNNLKGEIIDIHPAEGYILFTLKVFTVLSDFDLEDSEIEYVSPGDNPYSTIIRIRIDDLGDTDNDINSEMGVIPFQIAYAVSIHKAQGLEYSSVKIIITREVEDMISHNIFYTAITRTRDKLKIYWTPETEKRVLENMHLQFNDRDRGILRSRNSDV